MCLYRFLDIRDENERKEKQIKRYDTIYMMIYIPTIEK